MPWPPSSVLCRITQVFDMLRRRSVLIVVSVTTDRSLLNHTLYIIIFNVNADLHRPYSLCTAHIFDIYVGLLKLASVISMGTKQAACQLVFDHKVEVAWKVNSKES